MDDDGNETGPTRATRLTIVHRGNDLTVLSSQSVRMIVPPSDQTYSLENHAGFWFEVRSADDECLYRRVIPNPFVGDVEAPSGDPERPFTRVPSDDKEKVSVLLVPEHAQGRQLMLFASPKGEPHGRARALAALDLQKPVGKMKILSTRIEGGGTAGPAKRKPRSPKRRK